MKAILPGKNDETIQFLYLSYKLHEMGHRKSIHSLWVTSGEVRQGLFIELTVSSLPDEETIWDCSFLYILFYVLFLLPLKLTDTNTIGPSFHSTMNI